MVALYIPLEEILVYAAIWWIIVFLTTWLIHSAFKRKSRK